MFFKMRSAYSVAAISAVLTVAAVASAAYKVDKAQLTLSTTAGPGLMKYKGLDIVGKSSLLKVEETDTTVKFTTFLNSIDTGNTERKKHMEERFGKKGADSCSAITLTVPKDKIAKSGTIPGTFNFHCTPQPVTVNYNVAGDHVTANFTVDLRKHGKEDLWCTAGNTVCVANTAKVAVDLYIKH